MHSALSIRRLRVTFAWSLHQTIADLLVDFLPPLIMEPLLPRSEARAEREDSELSCPWFSFAPQGNRKEVTIPIH